MRCEKIKQSTQSINAVMTVFLGAFPPPSLRNDIKEMLSESWPGKWVACFLEKMFDFAVRLYPEEGWSATDSDIS